ncbi:MAG: hypothetical protein H7X91_07835 [Burkholderiales bacterium]|nr:hypothetical protein [Burkholderiales bacterium]
MNEASLFKPASRPGSLRERRVGRLVREGAQAAAFDYQPALAPAPAPGLRLLCRSALL